MNFNYLKRYTKPNPSLVHSLIDVATTVDGNVTFTGGLRVEGTINGSIKGDEHSMLILASCGTIGGSVQVTHAIIDGPINGPVVICELLELLPGARINGDVKYKSLKVHAGAILNGTLTSTQQQGEPV